MSGFVIKEPDGSTFDGTAQIKKEQTARNRRYRRAAEALVKAEYELEQQIKLRESLCTAYYDDKVSHNMYAAARTRLDRAIGDLRKSVAVKNVEVAEAGVGVANDVKTSVAANIKKAAAPAAESSAIDRPKTVQDITRWALVMLPRTPTN